MEASGVTDLLFKQLSFRSERQKVISSNIANIDTPKYKTKELSFDDHLNNSKTQSIRLATTNSMHIQIQDVVKPPKYDLFEVKGLDEQNDGNNVNLDTQMSEMSKNNTIFSAIQNSIKKDSTWFKLMVDASGKN
ncbi:MAG: flagellar basal body rod protein FlgB [Campylobacterales bacterium]|nr:flagellar basal body rod protein FlgB [Campylobacterales bacterium]